MKMLLTAIAGSVIALASGLALASGEDGTSPSGTAQHSGEPVLVELFTSQGCSSCPPADLLATKIKHEANLVVISRPVTYWDRLGWKDTLAREENTLLQRAYAQRGLSGRNGVYTPQMVVDGEYGLVGSVERDLRKAIANAAADAPAAIRAKPKDDGSWIVGFGGKAAGPTDIILVGVSSHERVAIGRGENGGRKIGYTNVLRSEAVVGRWEGGKHSMTVPASRLAMNDGSDRFAIILRDRTSGQVSAARWLDRSAS